MVERINAPDEVSEGGIITPSVQKHENHHALVYAVGNECEVAKAGDHILLGRLVGTSFKTEGREFIFVKEDEILAFIKD